VSAVAKNPPTQARKAKVPNRANEKHQMSFGMKEIQQEEKIHLHIS